MGEIITESNYGWQNGVIPKYSFNAKELDEENGMYYYSARYYAPPTFISRDMLFEQKPWISPYTYCSNSPINKIDPTGMNDWYPDENGNLIADKGDNAWTLAKYLNTSPEIAIKMLNEQGYSVNENGFLNLRIGDIFEIESTDNMPETREDLGVLGNLIRDQASSEFSKNMFENFWNGGGDIELTGKQFAGILLYLKKNNVKGEKVKNINLKGKSGIIYPGSSYNYSFYGTEYERAFGTSTIYYNSKGNVVGFYDVYDFDSKPWGKRSLKNELITRGVNLVSSRSSQSFKIRYGYSNR